MQARPPDTDTHRQLPPSRSNVLREASQSSTLCHGACPLRPAPVVRPVGLLNSVTIPTLRVGTTENEAIPVKARPTTRPRMARPRNFWDSFVPTKYEATHSRIATMNTKMAATNTLVVSCLGMYSLA